MKSIRESINKLLEKKGDTYDSGAIMLYFSYPQMRHIHNMIEPADLYEEEGARTFGIEDEVHATLLYGVSDEADERGIEEIISNYTFKEIRAFNASLFNTNPNYDVLKFDIEGDPLGQIHQELKSIPYKSDFPNFHPHVTIAYIQKGLGQKYADIINKKYPELWLPPSNIVYSLGNGEDHQIEIQIEQNND